MAKLVVYWDASAILSTLFQDAHSAMATHWIGTSHVHLLSSLGRAEVLAVIARLGRAKAVGPVLIESAFTALEKGPWRGINDNPPAGLLRGLAAAWPLRGADLWHLALAKSLQEELPELVLLTFDLRLAEAVAGEGLAPARGGPPPRLTVRFPRALARTRRPGARAGRWRGCRL